jgi:hypothetical protein
MGMAEENRIKFIPPSEYDRSISKSSRRRNLFGRRLMFHSSEPKEAVNTTARGATSNTTRAN